MPEAGPSCLPMEAPTIKQEPVEFGWSNERVMVVFIGRSDARRRRRVAPSEPSTP